MTRVAILIALLCGLDACATLREPPTVAMPTAYDGAGAGAALAPTELDHWWLLFKDPELNKLEDDAFRLSPDERTAAARILEARAAKASAIDQTLPTGGIQGNLSRQTATGIGAGSSNDLFPIGGVTTSRTLNFSPSWELDLFGRLAQQRKIARANYVASRFDIEGVRASLAASVADDYFQARGLAIQLADAQESEQIEDELERVATQKAQIGLGAATDADRVAGDLSQAKAQVESLQAQLHAIERQLLILVGRPFEPTANLPVDATVYDPPATPAAVPGDLLARRPDVRESEEKFRVEAGTAKLKHLAIFPTFTMLPGLGLSSVTQPGVGFIPPAMLFAQQQTTSLGLWSIAGGVTVPVLDIPRLLADARAEDARTEEAAISYEKTVQTAYGEAENALVTLAAAERGSTVLASGEVRAHSAYDAARRLYGMGLNDITATLSAEQDWRTTRSALTSARVLALRQAVATYKALGGGWAYSTSDFKER
ncbi:MAG TPA: TolC family protein [Caulobacteraceae bacterium]|jgi:NodT family efflux transporter outer membrane factor (OMF) lipoprotein|nr:TolC family protein [Caulobacteraceae bacterium]